MAEAATTTKKQVRVAMWGTPRSLSTAMMRSMWNRKSCKCLPEPFGIAYFFGPERRGKWFRNVETIDGCDYPSIKREIYEGAYDEDEVFVKDFPNYLYRQELHKPEDLIPSGFVHTFLLRSPRDVVNSTYKLFLKKEIDGFDEWDSGFMGFQSLWNFYNIIKQIQPDPLVIHADDLIAHPEATLRLYCERTGLQFEDSMLNWRENDGMDEKLTNVIPFLKVFTDTVMSSKGFGTQHSHKTQFELPPEMEKDVAENEIYYDKLMQFVTRVNPQAQQ